MVVLEGLYKGRSFEGHSRGSSLLPLTIGAPHYSPTRHLQLAYILAIADANDLHTADFCAGFWGH